VLRAGLPVCAQETNGLLKGFNLKANKITTTSTEYQEEIQYAVQIDSRWYQLTYTKKRVLDGREAYSDNIYKWDLVGHEHLFRITPFEEIEGDMPNLVQEFIHRFRESGKTSANLMEQREDHLYPAERHPGHTWGWNVERLKDDYIF